MLRKSSSNRSCGLVNLLGREATEKEPMAHQKLSMKQQEYPNIDK